MNLILTILRNIPLLKSLTEEEHKAIIDHITMQYFPAHYKLFEKGVLGSAMYIIKSGVVRIYNETGDLATLKDNDFFGEMALIESQPRMAGAETLSDCEIFVLNKEDFASLMQKSPDIAQKVEEAYKSRKDQNSTL
jgi:CRP-like cAMP-binding protein